VPVILSIEENAENLVQSEWNSTEVKPSNHITRMHIKKALL